MGDVGNFLFGGSESEQTGQNQYSSAEQSSNQSQNNAVNVSASGSQNRQVSSNQEYNQAYAPIAAAMTPALGYTTGAGNMMAALLGLPPSSYAFSYEQEPYAPPPPPTINEGDLNVTLPNLEDIVDALAGSTPTLPPPAPTPAPNPNTPAPTPPPATPPPAPPPATPPSSGNPFTGIPILDPNYGAGTGTARGGSMSDSLLVQPLAQGGRARPGRAYLVGENEPEIFVPDQPGTVVPGPLGAAGLQGNTGRGDWREHVMQRMASRGIAPPSHWGSSPTAPPATPGTPGTPAPTTPIASTTPAPTTGTPAPAANPASALETFSDSAGMNFILDQGQKAISGASAANGVFNSGATGKALVQYGQGLGQTYLNQYMQHLASLGQLGLGAGSAMSNAGGVGGGSSFGGGSSASIGGGLSSGSSSGQSSGASQGGSTSSGSSNSKDGLLNTDAAAAGAAAAATSDIRLKTDVELLYRDEDGLGHYEWNWITDPSGPRVRGVLAHEVKELRPKAYIKGFVDGVYDGVDYALLEEGK